MYRTQHKSEASPLVKPELAAHITSQSRSEPHSQPSDSHSIPPRTIQRPSDLNSWGRDDDTTAVVTFLRLALLFAQLMLAIGIIVSLCQVHEVIRKFTNVVETSTITTTATARVTYTDWHAPMVTISVTKKTETVIETQTVLPTESKHLKEVRRIRDGGAVKTTVDTIYTPEITVSKV